MAQASFDQQYRACRLCVGARRLSVSRCGETQSLPDLPLPPSTDAAQVVDRRGDHPQTAKYYVHYVDCACLPGRGPCAGGAARGWGGNAAEGKACPHATHARTLPPGVPVVA